MSFDLASVDWAALKVKAETVLADAETVLKDLEPLEALVPLPASVKTVLSELPGWLADVDSVIEKL